MKTGKRFCGHCGAELLTKVVPQFTVWRPKFDTRTGKQNFQIEYRCPNYGAWFGLNHYHYYENKDDHV